MQQHSMAASVEAQLFQTGQLYQLRWPVWRLSSVPAHAGAPVEGKDLARLLVLSGLTCLSMVCPDACDLILLQHVCEQCVIRIRLHLSEYELVPLVSDMCIPDL